MKKLAALVCAACLAAPPAAAQDTKRYDVLELPAVQSPLAQRALVYSLSRAGERVIATGIRGHILYSDDFGHSWVQAESVPVRSSLLDAAFPTPEQGWVVGHEGVILHSTDGGKTWARQLDGVQLAKIGLDFYSARLEQEPDNERYAFLVDELTLALEGNADRPFFKIVMNSASEGFAAGAYGLLFSTVDGGKSWVPVMERLDLEQFVHLFDYARLPPATTDNPGPDAVELVAAGEMGTILALDPATGLWQPRDFPYDGSMFTIVATRDAALVTGGLRGLAFRSTDRGASWTEVDKPTTGAIVASTLLADGRVILATQEGALLASSDDGASFVPLPIEHPQPLSDLIEARPGELVLSGTFGLRVVSLPP